MNGRVDEIQLHELKRVDHDTIGENGRISQLLDDHGIFHHALQTRLDALKVGFGRIDVFGHPLWRHTPPFHYETCLDVVFMQ